MFDEFDGIYGPIVGSSETSTSHRPVDTDPAILARANRLRKEYDELRGDLVQELDAVEVRMTQPAENAKNYLLPMKKTIKKRNDKKVRVNPPATQYESNIPFSSPISSGTKAKSITSWQRGNAPNATMRILSRQMLTSLLRKRFAGLNLRIRTSINHDIGLHRSRR